ncbi:hypothetical protein T12_12746 [Trichinella patagoniensis]|uniref:Uncharacterized protein n=1 Tax=Trichinella patagoniensis TaxID=990121 RepID=A0A0V0ZJ75_9BILA|nr:hypothetical protein T12_12746 [Trichinella patagoniensis]
MSSALWLVDEKFDSETSELAKKRRRYSNLWITVRRITWKERGGYFLAVGREKLAKFYTSADEVTSTVLFTACRRNGTITLVSGSFSMIGFSYLNNQHGHG